MLFLHLSNATPTLLHKPMKKPFLTLILSLVLLGSYAQKATMSGTITDKKSKLTLIGVNIYIKGTSLGASTDLQGRYKITNVPTGIYNLEISYIGYEKTILTGIQFAAGETKKLDYELSPTDKTFDEVVIYGDKPLVDIEDTKTTKQVSSDQIAAAPTRQIQGVLNTQSGVVLNPEGISIRGGRTYETAFYIDGVSATDPLAGTGFGIDLGTNSVSSISVTTGGGDVAFGDGTAGIVNTSTKTGGDKMELSMMHKRDNLGFNKNSVHVWNNSINELSLGGSVRLKTNKLRYFVSFKNSYDDQYFKVTAKQVKSSLFPQTQISPTQDNRYAASLKLNYDFNPRTRLALTYLRSITINQDINMLRITGNDVPFFPGFQFDYSLQPDNANTYTHSTNLVSLTFNHNPSKKYAYSVTASRLFVKLRADANGRSWRPLNVDSEFDPRVINTFPTQNFNPDDSVVFVLPAAGLYNNGGIATLWHDHYVEELGLRYNGNYYYNSRGDKLSFGTEFKQQDMQWIDILRPWIGAPTQLPNGDYTQSFRLGDYSDVWRVQPTRGAFYFSNKTKFRGLIAEVGARIEYWMPGKFVDEAVKNSVSPIRDEIRAQYQEQTIGLGNRRVKMRVLPKISASFPIKENQVMFFNYNHSMILPHPSFIYAGLNPNYQDRSTLARVGNPNLNPEVDISYELGLRSQISGNDAVNVSAYWKDKYDFITSASVQIKDATGRNVTRTLSINADYARVRGLELSYVKRIGTWFNGQVSAAYSVATGQSSSASEALKDILNSGVREDTKEQYLAWDSPLDLKGFVTLSQNSKTGGLFGKDYLNQMSFYVEAVYRTGRRYTPYIFINKDPLSGRPVYERDPNPEARYSKLGDANYWLDMNLRKWWSVGKMRVEASLEITNLVNTQNTIIPNPVTGSGYQAGDNVPSNWQDPRYLDPRDGRSSNLPPNNPARYRAPRHTMLGVAIKF